MILGSEEKTTSTQSYKLNRSKKMSFIKDPLVRNIANRIYKNIDYPKETSNKRLSGAVVLSFKVYEDGTATITKLEGNEQFYLSVRESVKRAFPIKIVDRNISFPRDMRIKINFRVKK
jgi:outer membrane biosynthesis protein TonB